MTVPANADDAAPPDPSTGDSTDDKGGRTYTQEELDRKLRGQGKALEEMKAKLAAYEADKEKAKKKADEAKRKKMEEEGDLKGLLSEREKRIADLENALSQKDSAISGFQEKEMARLEALKDDNQKRLKALPKALHDLVVDDDPDKMAMRLSRVEKLRAEDGQTINVRGRGGRGNENVEPDDPVQASYDMMNAAIDKRKRGGA